MLLDLPRGQVRPDAMLRVDLDGTTFQVPEGMQFKAKKERVEAVPYLWASGNQAGKEIAPLLSKFLAKGDPKKGKSAALPGWQRLHQELEVIGSMTQEPLFQRAADALAKNHADIIKMVAAAQEKATKVQKAIWESQKTQGSGSYETPYTRILFYLDGKPIQDHPAYKKYRKMTYEAVREKGTVTLTDGLGEVCPNMLLTSPGAFLGMKLGSNIPTHDPEATCWGYRQNSRMWVTDDEYMARLYGMASHVPTVRFVSGDGKNKSELYVAIVNLEQASVDVLSSDKALLTMGIHGARKPTADEDGEDSSDTDPETVAVQETQSAGAWLVQEVQGLLAGMTRPKAPENHDLRLLVYYPEKTRMRVLTYEPMNRLQMAESICAFRKHYGGIRIPDLLECQEAPKPKGKRRAVTQREALLWTRRILRGGAPTLAEATRAFQRYITEIKAGTSTGYRQVCQRKILEDYMANGQNEGRLELYALGVCISDCANVAYETGRLSHQNKKGNEFARARKEAFIAKFLPMATQLPAVALTAMAAQINTYLKAIPAKHRHKAPWLRTVFDEAVFSATSSLEVLSGGLLAQDRLQVWKGYAENEQSERESGYQKYRFNPAWQTGSNTEGDGEEVDEAA